MFSHESLTDIERDLEQAFLEVMRGDYHNVTDASAKLITQSFMRRIESFTHYFAYQEARRLTNKYTISKQEEQ